MTHPVRLAVAGVGNNISGLLQGVHYYRELIERDGEDDLPGIRRTRIGGIGVSDVTIVGAFDVHPGKVGTDLRDAVLAPPNNYPRIAELPDQDVRVSPGLSQDGGANRESVVKSLADSAAEVLLYSLPTGLQWEAEEYARAAAEAGVAFVNCTPESVARRPELLELFEDASLPMVGDDLASHLGTSIVHRALLGLFAERGITLESSYQLNFGGNEDFRNLRERGSSKRRSKLNALAQEGVELGAVEVIPSAGYISHLQDHKVAILNLEGCGWAGTPVSLDLKLKVQDSSNAAGVIIDLVRIAAISRRLGDKGFPIAAATGLKSPAVGHDKLASGVVETALVNLDERARMADIGEPSGQAAE